MPRAEWLLDDEYHALVNTCISRGSVRYGMRNQDTIGIFGAALTHDMDAGFPIITTRKIFYKGVIAELAGFLEGATSLARFKELGCNYWDMNAEGKDDLGRIYGAQWRGFRTWDGEVDQLRILLDGLVNNPTSRRHLLTTWHPAEIHNMCLPPCHLLNQYRVTPETGRLDSLVYMRSVDLCLGLPSDLVLYGTLLMLIAQATGLRPGMLIFMLGDAHVYTNHIAPWVAVQDKREASLSPLGTPKLLLNHHASPLDFAPSQVQLVGYDPHPAVTYAFN